MSQDQQLGVTPRPLEDTEENYRAYLSYLLSQTKSRGNTRYYNKFAGRCKEEAVLYFPVGSRLAAKNDMAQGGFFVSLLALFGIF